MVGCSMCSGYRSEVAVGVRLARGRLFAPRSIGLAAWGYASIVLVGLLFVLPQAFDRAQRVEDRRIPITAEGSGGLRVGDRSTTYRGVPLTIVALAGPGDRRPPGVRKLPAPGEVVASPALAALLRDRGARAELAARLPGSVVGLVRDEGLAHPDELIAYLGVTSEGMGPQAERLVVWGRPLGQSTVEPLAPQLVVILSVFVALPLIGLGVLAIGAGRTERSIVAARLRIVGAGPVASTVQASMESLAPIGAGAVVGVLTRRAVADLVADRFPSSVQPFAKDLAPGGGGLLSVAAVVAVLAVVALAGALWPAAASRRTVVLRSCVGTVGVLAVWLVALIAGGLRLRSVDDIDGLDVALFAVLMGLLAPVQVRLVGVLLRRAGRGRSAVAQVAEAAYRRAGSGATRAQQAVAITLASLTLAAAAIVLWDAASLVDARFGLGRSTHGVAWVSADRTTAAELAGGGRAAVRLLRVDADLGMGRGTTDNIVVRCDDAAQLVADWSPADCGSALSNDRSPTPSSAVDLEVSGVPIQARWGRSVELLAPVRVVGSSSAVVLPVDAASFAAIDRGVVHGFNTDLVIFRLPADARQRDLEVEHLRERTLGSVAKGSARRFGLGEHPGSNVLVLTDLEREGRRFQEVYGTAARLVAIAAAAIGVLAFFIGTLTDARVVQPTTDRLDLVGASTSQLVGVALIRAELSLCIALTTGGGVGVVAGIRYLRAPGYDDVLVGWLHGFPAASILLAVSSAFVVGSGVCILGAVAGSRAGAVRRVRAS